MESEDLIPLSSNSPGESDDDGVGISCPRSRKRPSMTVDAQQPSVRVIYNSLTRESRKKLVELLQQWSEWRSQDCTSSNDSNGVLESGEEIYFPALNLGVEKALAVPFCIDNQRKNPTHKESIPMEGNSIPLYDRGFSSALTSVDGPNNLKSSSELLNSARCFNCGSYSHTLKECAKPRDNVAVNKAIKEHKSRRSQNASSRNPTRYFQSSPGGKFDGLRPGSLDSETKQLLGLGELDPPPWLNRMREIGYPPGYLDLHNGDQPSGITIFADNESKEEMESKIVEVGSHDQPRKRSSDPPKKMSVEYPGINVPIPENADKVNWKALRKHDVITDSLSKDYDFGTYNGTKGYQDRRPPLPHLRSCSQGYDSSDNLYSPYSDVSAQRSLDLLSYSRYSEDFVNRDYSHVPDRPPGSYLRSSIDRYHISEDFVNRDYSHVPDRPPGSYLRSSIDRYHISENLYSPYGDSLGRRSPDHLSYRRYNFSEDLINRDYSGVPDIPFGSHLGSSFDRHHSYDYRYL